MIARPTRWVKAATGPAGPCRICGGMTVRVRPLRPLVREEKLGGVAGFSICPTCDRVLLDAPIGGAA